MFRLLGGFFITIALAACSVAEQPNANQAGVTPHTGAVASPDQYGAMVAEQVLRNGGGFALLGAGAAFRMGRLYPTIKLYWS